MKEAKLEEEIQELLNNLSSATVNTLRDKVAWILNQYPDARDSDVTLMLHSHPAATNAGRCIAIFEW